MDNEVLEHHGILGQKWGVQNGLPYPIEDSKKNQVSDKELTEYRKKKIAEAPSKKDSPRGTNKGWWRNAPKNILKKYYLEEKKNEAESKDTILKKGTEIHRIVPKSWVDNEKSYSGHAYASYETCK